MKNLKIIALLGLVIIPTQQIFSMEESQAVASANPVATEVAPVALVTAPIAPVVAAQAVQPVAVPVAAPVTSNYAAESKAMFTKFSIAAYDAMKRASHDVRAVIVSAVAVVKNVSEDVSRSVRHFIHEKTAPYTADKNENVVVQTQRRDNRLDNNQSATTWVPVYAYELINGESVPYIAYYEEAQPTSSEKETEEDTKMNDEERQ